MLKMTISGREFNIPTCAEELTFEQYFRLASESETNALGIAAAVIGIEKTTFSALKVANINLADIAQALEWLNEHSLRSLQTLPCELPEELAKNMTLGDYAEILSFIDKNKSTLSIYQFILTKMYDISPSEVGKMPAFKVLQQGSFFLKSLKTIQKKSKKRDGLIRRVLTKFWQILGI